jgi:hypothetical protein
MGVANINPVAADRLSDFSPSALGAFSAASTIISIVILPMAVNSPGSATFYF